MYKTKILIADDEPDVCKFLEDILSDEGYILNSVYNGEAAVEKFSQDFYDLVLLDIGMPGMNGIQVLRKLKKLDPNVTVIMVTALVEVETVVEAMKLGAENYIVKPFRDIVLIKTAIQSALKIKEIKDENKYLKSYLKFRDVGKHIVGNCPKMRELYSMIEKVAPLLTTILLIGETGTGKELIARAIHDLSLCKGEKFVSINCGGIPETLLESTLFGYEKGAFTGAYKRTKGVFEEADGGTLFLDEIGETSHALQVKLLRVLQDNKFQRVGGTEEVSVDVRIISATNKDLATEVKNKKFREDLYYRINVITLFIPPLRERIDDIPLMVKFFVDKYSSSNKKDVKGFDQESIKIMKKYPWPGNIRELENVVERAVALAENPIISKNELPDVLKRELILDVDRKSLKPFAVAKQQFEKRYLSIVLERNNWNVTKAAAESGIPRQNLYLKIKKYQINKS